MSNLLLPSGEKRALPVSGGPGKGMLFELDPRWETHYWDGSCELEVQEVIQSRLRVGGTLYDVGANFGFLSVLAARQGAQVFAFEPDMQNADSLERHARMNGVADRITIIRSAVLSVSGVVSLEPATYATGHGNAHVRDTTDQSDAALKVACITLDEFARGHHAPDIVKIDVEGAESSVLRGAEELFLNTRPLLVCEVHDSENASFIDEWLKARRYKFRWLGGKPEFPRQLLAEPN